MPTATADLSQRESVLWHLRNYGSIDRRTAADEYGVGRLAARIYELRREGHEIRKELNEDGIAVYYLD